MSEDVRHRIEPTPVAPSPVADLAVPAESAPSESEMPPSLFVEAGKEPYANEVLDTHHIYKQFDMKPLTDAIDRFVNREIDRLHLADTKETYAKVLEKYSKQFEGTDPYAKIESIYKLVTIDERLRNLAKDREELLKADPSTLTSGQLKTWLSHRGISYGH